MASVLLGAGGSAWFASACTGRDGERQLAEVYGLNERLSGPVKERALGLRRLLGLCDFDSYHVRIDGVDHCLVLNGGRDGPLATVVVMRRDDEVIVDGASVATLSDIATRLEELTSQRSRHLVLSVGRRPIALVPVASLSKRGPIHLETFE